MNVRAISNDGMRQILNEWLAKGERRAIIERDPLLSANIEHLEEARDAFASLSTAQGLPDAEQARIEAALKKISAEIDDADGDFEQPARACVALLDAAAEVGDESTAAQVLAARRRLFPRGLSILNLSAAEEAGVALGMDDALDDERRALLAKIELKSAGQRVTALALVEQQIEAGKRLGKLVAQRDKIIADRDASAGGDENSTKSALARFGEARNTIVRAISDFVRDVQRARKIGQADRALLLSTVEQLSALAQQREARKGKPLPPEPPSA